MSQTNVEVVTDLLDAANAFNRGELTPEAFAESCDPEIEMRWHDAQTYPDAPQQLRGVEAVLGFSEQFRAAYADALQEPLEHAEAPDGRVLTPTRLTARGRESGIPIEIHFFQLMTVRGGKVCRIEMFRHRTDALEAAGLSK